MDTSTVITQFQVKSDYGRWVCNKGHDEWWLLEDKWAADGGQKDWRSIDFQAQTLEEAQTRATSIAERFDEYDQAQYELKNSLSSSMEDLDVKWRGFRGLY